MASLAFVTFVTLEGLGGGIGHVLEGLGVGGVLTTCSMSVGTGVIS